jgi:putative tryptophan/tyrosine transport system substrate-binding protein
MKRREFLGLAAGAAAAWPLAAQAQQKKGMLRVAWVGFLPRSSPLVATTPRRLAEFGYREDENLVIDYVQVAGSEEAIYAGTRELAARKPDILLAVGPEAALKAAIAYAPTTPIVMLAADYDPVARGYVSSLARPGGRITGLLPAVRTRREAAAILQGGDPGLNLGDHLLRRDIRGTMEGRRGRERQARLAALRRGLARPAL